jgi:hypothetical protein
MKTAKLFALISLTAIFAISLVAYSNSALTDNPKGFSTASVSYDVYVHFVSDASLCGAYFVQVTDEKGRPVAAAKQFVPGVTKYNFHEYGIMRGKVRIANLIQVTYPHHFVCVYSLSTSPAVKEGPFLYGHTYSFDLYPALNSPEITDQD